MSFAMSVFRRQGPWNIDQYRIAAQRRLPRAVFDFVDGGADDESTLRENRSALAALKLLPRVALGELSYDTNVTLLGQELALPVLLAPTGLPGLVHPDAELAAVRAAEAAGTRIVLSTGSSYSLEEVAAVSNKKHWFQLYAWRDEDFVDSLVARAERAGYATLCITLDVPAVGHRERDTRNGFTLPPRVTASNALDLLKRPRWIATAGRRRNFVMRNFLDGDLESDLKRPLSTLEKNISLIDPRFSWRDVERIRSRWSGTVAVKGIMHPLDAVRAVEAGADAIVVSNHGGRQLDSAPATISALPAVVDAVGGHAQVVMDGGIRRGSDVVKAMALGADACLIGRPWLYGLAVAGQDGVASVLTIIRDEIVRTMTLLGCESLGAIGREVLFESFNGERP